MAIIYSYPRLSTPTEEDLLIVTDVTDNSTKSMRLGDIPPTGPSGSGTPLTVPLWITSDSLGDSVITQDSKAGAKYISIDGLVYQEAGGSTYFGKNAGNNDDQTSANNNVGIGQGALLSQVTGNFGGAPIPSENVAIGFNALAETTGGTNNIAIGADSLAGNTDGFNNVAISKNALGETYTLNNTSVGIGFSAGNPLAASGAIDGHVGNTMLGHQSLADFNVVAASNVRYNVTVGFRSLRNLGGPGANYVTAIEDNVAIGRQAGLNITPSKTLQVKTNVLVGKDAGFGIKPGASTLQNNILLGANAGNSQALRDNNIVLQSNAGNNILGKEDGVDVYPVSDNIILGGRSNVYASDNIVIGNALAANENTIGNDATTDAITDRTIRNVILGGYNNQILNDSTAAANENIIIGSNTTEIAANDPETASKNFIASSIGVNIDGGDKNACIISNGATVQGNDNVLLNATSGTVDGTENVIMNSNNTTATGNNNIVGAGTNVTIAQNANFNVAFGTDHTINPTLGTVLRNVAIGNGNVVRGGNNGFVGGFNSSLDSGDHSFAYGNGITSANGSCAHVGKFNKPNPTGQGSGLFQVGCGFNKAAGARNAINIAAANITLASGAARNNSAIVYLDELVFQDYVDDTAAAAGGIELGGLYHTNGTVKIRIA